MSAPSKIWSALRDGLAARRRRALLDDIVRRQNRGHGVRRRWPTQKLAASVMLVGMVGLGVHAVAGSPLPSMWGDWRRFGVTEAQQHQGPCLIKGNVSSRGERIYHVPGGEFYSRTIVNPAKGERWFCTEAEARAAGWRRSRR